MFAIAPRYAFFGREERGPRLFAGLALEAFEGWLRERVQRERI